MGITIVGILPRDEILEWLHYRCATVKQAKGFALEIPPSFRAQLAGTSYNVTRAEIDESVAILRSALIE